MYVRLLADKMAVGHFFTLLIRVFHDIPAMLQRRFITLVPSSIVKCVTLCINRPKQDSSSEADSS